MTEKRKKIRICPHALERFEQRIIPRITDDTQGDWLSDRGNAERALYSIVSNQSLTPVENKENCFHAFFNSQGWFLPIILVIRDGLLITLWENRDYSMI